MEVINNPQASQASEGNGFGFLVGVILVILTIFAMLYFGLPMLRNTGVPSVPTPQQSQPQTQNQPEVQPNINIPDDIDVNIKDGN